jgi:hypothetical protein
MRIKHENFLFFFALFPLTVLLQAIGQIQYSVWVFSLALAFRTQAWHNISLLYRTCFQENCCSVKEMVECPAHWGFCYRGQQSLLKTSLLK